MAVEEGEEDEQDREEGYTAGMGLAVEDRTAGLGAVRPSPLRHVRHFLEIAKPFSTLKPFLHGASFASDSAPLICNGAPPPTGPTTGSSPPPPALLHLSLLLPRPPPHTRSSTLAAAVLPARRSGLPPPRRRRCFCSLDCCLARAWEPLQLPPVVRDSHAKVRPNSNSTLPCRRSTRAVPGSAFGAAAAPGEYEPKPPTRGVGVASTASVSVGTGTGGRSWWH